uniref:Calponin-homology (CH) domain-containing protein n=1 Tax=Oncorhynchus mykiss TaxID=8022 RepID=A0A8C7Q0Q3_ONCMY
MRPAASNSVYPFILRTYTDAKGCCCVQVLLDWINNELEEDRIIFKDLEEDCYDGQSLCVSSLLVTEKLSGRKINVAEVTQSERGQKQMLQTVLESVNQLLRPHSCLRPNIDRSIHTKNLVAILYLLVTLAMHYLSPIRLSKHMSVQVVVVKVRRHNTYLLSVFADGVYLVLLMGLLEDYFVPLYNFFLTPENFEQKVHNVAFAFELMQDGGLKKPKAKPDDIVNLNLKSTLRVLYNIFTKYKNSE